MTGISRLALWLSLTIIGKTAFAHPGAHYPAPSESAKHAEQKLWGKVAVEVSESFESASLDLSYPSGFTWGAARSRSIVRDDQYIVWKGAPRLDGPFSDPDRAWEGITGRHALMFSYPAGKNGFAEQRFSLGRAYPDLWIGYWLRVPTNWEHGTGNTNNKFFAIWMDEYEYKGPGATGVIQIRNAGDGDSIISPYAMTRDNHHPGETPGKLLIRSPEDRGRWMQVVVHAKMASAPTARDGVFEMFRRWQGEAKFEEIFSFNDWDNFHVGGNKGFAHGYLMGWANATQAYESEWLLDDLVVSEHSLLGVQAVTDSSQAGQRSRPAIPNFVVP